MRDKAVKYRMCLRIENSTLIFIVTSFYNMPSMKHTMFSVIYKHDRDTDLRSSHLSTINTV